MVMIPVDEPTGVPMLPMVGPHAHAIISAFANLALSGASSLAPMMAAAMGAITATDAMLPTSIARAHPMAMKASTKTLLPMGRLVTMAHAILSARPDALIPSDVMVIPTSERQDVAAEAGPDHLLPRGGAHGGQKQASQER